MPGPSKETQDWWNRHEASLSPLQLASIASAGPTPYEDGTFFDSQHAAKYYYDALKKVHQRLAEQEETNEEQHERKNAYERHRYVVEQKLHETVLDWYVSRISDVEAYTALYEAAANYGRMIYGEQTMEDMEAERLRRRGGNE